MSAINFTTQKIGADEVAVLTFDLPNEKVNKLSTSVMTELKAHIEKIKELKTIEQVQSAVNSGQSIFNMIEDLPMPTMALVNGACAGGGCELILACDYRIATDDSSTRIGLPETQLGILPGFGGCIRMPRILGLQNALGIILAG